jgi:hypothetical protein
VHTDSSLQALRREGLAERDPAYTAGGAPLPAAAHAGAKRYIISIQKLPRERPVTTSPSDEWTTSALQEGAL